MLESKKLGYAHMIPTSPNTAVVQLDGLQSDLKCIQLSVNSKFVDSDRIKVIKTVEELKENQNDKSISTPIIINDDHAISHNKNLEREDQGTLAKREYTHRVSDQEDLITHNQGSKKDLEKASTDAKNLADICQKNNDSTGRNAAISKQKSAQTKINECDFSIRSAKDNIQKYKDIIDGINSGKSTIQEEKDLF